MPAPRDDGAAAPFNPRSIIRRFLMWWFRQPWGIAYVSVNVAVDASAALAWLKALPPGPDGQRPTLQHLLAAAVGRSLARFPAANARIVGGQIVPSDRVGLAMPVNLVGVEGVGGAELGIAVVEDVHLKSVLEIAADTRRAVSGERKGKSANPLIRLMKTLAADLPQPAFEAVLDGMHRAVQHPRAASALFDAFPVTAGLTNPGASLAGVQGARMLGGAFSLPQRLVHVGTLWGITPVHDDVLAINGKPEVRPVLPVLLIFDHRLIDGVMAGRLLKHFVQILLDPAAAFGADGGRRGEPLPGGPRGA